MLGLRVAIDVNCAGVFAAGDAIFLVNRAGHHIAVTAGLGIAPGDRRPGGASFQRLDFGDNGAPLVLVIKRPGAIARTSSPACGFTRAARQH